MMGMYSFYNEEGGKKEHCNILEEQINSKKEDKNNIY